jgi:hypothetical protein
MENITDREIDEMITDINIDSLIETIDDEIFDIEEKRTQLYHRSIELIERLEKLQELKLSNKNDIK